MHKYGLLAAAAVAALALAAAPAIAEDYGSDTGSKQDLGIAGAKDDASPGAPQGDAEVVPGSMHDERRPASSGEDDLDVGEPEADAGRRDDTGAVDAPGPAQGDDAGSMVPGSASPGTAMDDIEVDAAGTTAGGERDKTGGYDARGPIQNDQDAEASAESSGSPSDYASPLHQRNLQQAMDPKNGRYRRSRTHTGTGAGSDVAPTGGAMDDDSVNDIAD